MRGLENAFFMILKTARGRRLTKISSTVMANELHSLSALFQNRLFRIPDYQRGYAWKYRHLSAFWEDLINLHEERFHYTGLLSLKGVSQDQLAGFTAGEWLPHGYNLFNVVDGQQRLTTISILLFELVSFVKSLPENAGKSEGQIVFGDETLRQIREKYIVRNRPAVAQNLEIVKTYMFGYDADNPSAEYLKFKVFEEPFGSSVCETYYTKNLKEAKEFFAGNLKFLYRSDGLEGLQLLYRKLTLRLMFNLYEIKDDYDVFVAFETMNNRGKQLTKLELLKNRLIYLTTLFDQIQLDVMEKNQLRKNINEAWKEVYYQLGRNQHAELVDDEFLRAHWITYFQYSRKVGSDYIKFLLEKFSAKNVFEMHVPLSVPEEDIIMSDGESGEDEDLQDGQGEIDTQLVSRLVPSEISEYVDSLKSLAEYWYSSFFPFDSDFSEPEKVWLDKLNHIGIGYFRPLVVAVLSTRRDTLENDRLDLLKAVERFIFVSFRIGGFQSNYQSSVYYSKARDVLRGEASLAEITESLGSTVNQDMASAVKTFIARTNRRFDSEKGFYGWRDLRYFLFEYEFEKSVQNNLSKANWEMFSKVEKDKVTIEHILPQTPTNLYWRNAFRMFDEGEIRQLSGSLGNLLPLSQSINSSLQNDSFDDKKSPPTLGRRGYLDGSHSEIEVAKESRWTADQILQRGKMLLDFMADRWRIELTDEDKLALLHIPFVEDGRDVLPELQNSGAESTGSK